MMIRDVPREFLILGEEVDQNTSPLSQSPLWKNESSTARDGNWSSTQIRSGKKGKREKGQRNGERGTQRQSVVKLQEGKDLL